MLCCICNNKQLILLFQYILTIITLVIVRVFVPQNLMRLKELMGEEIEEGNKRKKIKEALNHYRGM